MTRFTDLCAKCAHRNFLKGSSYFNGDFPDYISFEPINSEVNEILRGKLFFDFNKENPANFSNVNYEFTHNKDGRLAWRPYELIHPVIYVSLVNLICAPDNWEQIQKRFLEFEGGAVECCSVPTVSDDDQSDQAAQVRGWWHEVEQKSLQLSLKFSHLLHTDVTDCYGSLYTHSIAWALHGKDEAKKEKTNNSLLGNQIDRHIQAGRYGQTNGICQGSVLMDFIAELVLGYVDTQITNDLKDVPEGDYRILRYRDDYRIFTRNDALGESILRSISDQLRAVGMKLGSAKTIKSENAVAGSVKPDKFAGIQLQDLGKANAKTIQKQLLRLHQFGQRFPNSGALMRLVAEFHKKIVKQKKKPDDLKVQVAIATDIAFVSPRTFPAIAGILSHLISLAEKPEEKSGLWKNVREKMKRIPFNGYLDIWLQRVIVPSGSELSFESDEPICQIVNSKTDVKLWENGWLDSEKLKAALATKAIVVGDPKKENQVMQPKEIELFITNQFSS